MNKTDFSRTRKQPFGDMLLFMFNFIRKSLPIEIDNFVNFINSNKDSVIIIIIIENYYVENKPDVKLFYGFRIIAVDGSKITLPFI
jgi:hypothetical protein